MNVNKIGFSGTYALPLTQTQYQKTKGYFARNLYELNSFYENNNLIIRTNNPQYSKSDLLMLDNICDEAQINPENPQQPREEITRHFNQYAINNHFININNPKGGQEGDEHF